MKNILFVCTGNTCRSPMAQGICQKIAKARNININVKSAGISTISGLPVAENAISVCKEIGVDIKDFRTTFIGDINLYDFDHIFVMANSHKIQMLSLGIDKEKVSVLAEDRGGISDPYGGDLTTYRKCRDEIYSEIENSIKEL